MFTIRWNRLDTHCLPAPPLQLNPLTSSLNSLKEASYNLLYFGAALYFVLFHYIWKQHRRGAIILRIGDISFKNWTGAPVGPEKTRTGDHGGLLSAQDGFTGIWNRNHSIDSCFLPYYRVYETVLYFILFRTVHHRTRVTAWPVASCAKRCVWLIKKSPVQKNTGIQITTNCTLGNHHILAQTD
jgi:hypothetical protein